MVENGYRKGVKHKFFSVSNNITLLYCLVQLHISNEILISIFVLLLLLTLVLEVTLLLTV